jgi:predicted phosphodiesterase
VTRLALISDIHGNCVALDAVVADATRHEVDAFICLGDVAATGPQPREALRRLRELGCANVRGNGEGWLLDGFPAGRSDGTRRLSDIIDWTLEQLAPNDLDYLAGFPPTVTRQVGGWRLLCFHGSPRSDIERLLATTSDDDLAHALTPELVDARVFAGGHTHLQLLRTLGDRVLVNPGSVGLPLGSLVDGDPPLPSWAEYALIEADQDVGEVAFRRVPVDVEELAAATAAMPHATWAVDLGRRIRRWNAGADP